MRDCSSCSTKSIGLERVNAREPMVNVLLTILNQGRPIASNEGRHEQTRRSADGRVVR
ncbi:hypothetical protein BOSEA31B_14190 [Hyphomicrobiales bacterium]|nr:hypothetical protein BOSEA31B_14190 [Hyphomicrobiales bacterium]CAH1699967.1 hypothetical protein BOSEA1005_13020 [Hyphomicrobiales bacterium]